MTDIEKLSDTFINPFSYYLYCLSDKGHGEAGEVGHTLGRLPYLSIYIQD